MVRAPCKSLLSFSFAQKDQTLTIKARHQGVHQQYADLSVKPAIREFVSRNIENCPSKLFRMIRSRLELQEDAKNLTEHQVRYVWHALTSRVWLRNPDAFVSAQTYASQEPQTDSTLLTCPGYEGLCILDKATVAELKKPGIVEELSIDATYGTNSAGYTLYAVLAELDGTGIPLAYMFARPTNMPKATAQEMINAFSEVVDDDPESESMAGIKVQQLLRNRHHLSTHLQFLRFCRRFLKMEPELVFGYKLLPSLATMRKFTYFYTATHQGRTSDHVNLRTVVESVARELTVLRCLSTLDFTRSDKTQLYRFIYNNLRTMFSLSTTSEKKPTATFCDFQAIVSHLSSTGYLATKSNMMEALLVLLFINLYIDTGARGADLLKDSMKVEPAGIKWRNVKFYLLPSEVEPTKVVFAAEVNYLVTKLTKRSRKAKPTLLVELPNTPFAFDTAALLFTLAFISGVFPCNISWHGLHQKHLETAEAIPTNLSKADDYVFPNCSDFKYNEKEGFDIARMRRCLSRVGKQLGFIDILVPYALRRMVGNAAEKDVDVSIMERQQLMGHSVGSNVFQQHYLETLLQLDVQQLTRNLPEDSVFLDGISGYSARKIKNRQQHDLAVQSLVEDQDDIIFLRRKSLDIRMEYNSKYGSKRAARKADPELMNEALKVQDKLKSAIEVHQSRFSKQLLQKSFDFRLSSLLENPSPQDDAALVDERHSARTIEIIEGRHISEWLLKTGDRTMAMNAVSWPTADRAPNNSGPLIQLLALFLNRVRDAGFRPSFFACDKDSAEIAAISEAFPAARVQLCYWHVLRAIRSKLSSYKSTQGHLYNPEGAQRVIPHLEVCWGSRIDKRPTNIDIHLQHVGVRAELSWHMDMPVAWRHPLSKSGTRCWP